MELSTDPDRRGLPLSIVLPSFACWQGRVSSIGRSRCASSEAQVRCPPFTPRTRGSRFRHLANRPCSDIASSRLRDIAITPVFSAIRFILPVRRSALRALTSERSRGEAMSDSGDFPRALTIAVGMQKGGVAKTTNACHLAVALAERGRRVLLWDVDENYGATKVFGIPPEGFWTTMSVLKGDATVEDAILEYDDPELDVDLPERVDLIPSSRLLQNVDAALSSVDPFYNPNEALRLHIDRLRQQGRYDYVILDTGPQASPTTRSSYMVSDYFILSLIPEKQAIASLPDALEDIQLARRTDRNPRLHLLGLILSCMDRRRTLARRYEEMITDRFLQSNQEPVKFKTTVSSAAAIDRAYNHRQTLLQFEPRHRVSEEYRELAREVEERIAHHQAFSRATRQDAFVRSDLAAQQGVER